MTVTVHYACDGCSATAEGTERLRAEFRSVSGRSYGFGSVQPVNSPQSVAPEGWVVFDPWTFATYCPTCWKSILEVPGSPLYEGEE
jgi:hypothetical protein